MLREALNTCATSAFAITAFSAGAYVTGAEVGLADVVVGFIVVASCVAAGSIIDHFDRKGGRMTQKVDLWRACQEAWIKAGMTTPCNDAAYIAARGAYHSALGLDTPEARKHLSQLKTEAR